MPIITIMPDYGQAYAWGWSGDEPAGPGVGGNIGDSVGWFGDQPISEDLEHAFIKWQGEFESYALVETDSPAGGNYSRFNWPLFHERGIALAIRLKAELGESAVVIYETPYEDESQVVRERTEILACGQLKPLPSRRALAALE